MGKPSEEPPVRKVAELRSRTDRPIHDCLQMVGAAIPPGEYRAVCGTDDAEVEVAADNSVVGTLLPATK